MAPDTLTDVLGRSVKRDLGVADLFQAAETLKRSGAPGAVDAAYSVWIQYNHDHPLLYTVLFNHAVTLSDSGNLAAARDSLERAVALAPDFLPARINLGRVLERLGATGAAIQHWLSVATKLAAVNGATITHKTTALNQAARVLEFVNQDEAAESLLRQSLEIDTTQREVAQHFLALRQRQCEWPLIAPWERVGRDVLTAGLSPLSIAAYADDPVMQLAVAWTHNRLDVGHPPLTALPAATARASGPLRIGYLSSDLREHAVGHLLGEVFELHDRSAVETFAYYCGPEAADPIHARFKATADHWVPVGDLDDETAARRIAGDGIQILVDLNGYTREGRLALVARRPAPVIVNWLGFPGTMASPYHHYIIADDWIIPEDHELYYSEKVLRLPCYQPNNRKRIVSPRPPSRAEARLPEDAMVYCCFNGTQKITRFTFERWLTILDRVPGGVLWLLGGTGATNERLGRHAARWGIDPGRVIFAERLGNPEHLARYALADLFLDSTPYGAHTTASDALWMGVPVLTLSGRSFASRVCGSLVRAAGLPELACASVEEYIGRAVAFGADRASLRPYRERLAAGRETCALFDTPLLVNRLEGLYRRMWDDFDSGALPSPDIANLGDYFEAGLGVDHDETEVQMIEDYQGWWYDRLARRHASRPIPADRRLFTAVPPGVYSTLTTDARLDDGAGAILGQARTPGTRHEPRLA